MPKLAPTMLSNMKELPTIKLGDHTLQMELNELSPEVQEIARKELRETPDVKRDAIIAPRDLSKGKYLLNVLRGAIITLRDLLKGKYLLNVCKGRNINF
ncbi:hypothetical protein JTB14_024177 [Gonioctena quinquepunctata]|nr:hypothetical protein JTB14_024177 [Gonioctena quinquepunctata]